MPTSGDKSMSAGAHFFSFLEKFKPNEVSMLCLSAEEMAYFDECVSRGSGREIYQLLEVLRGDLCGPSQPILTQQYITGFVDDYVASKKAVAEQQRLLSTDEVGAHAPYHSDPYATLSLPDNQPTSAAIVTGRVLSFTNGSADDPPTPPPRRYSLDGSLAANGRSSSSMGRVDSSDYDAACAAAYNNTHTNTVGNGEGGGYGYDKYGYEPINGGSSDVAYAPYGNELGAVGETSGAIVSAAPAVSVAAVVGNTRETHLDTVVQGIPLTQTSASDYYQGWNENEATDEETKKRRNTASQIAQPTVEKGTVLFYEDATTQPLKKADTEAKCTKKKATVSYEALYRYRAMRKGVEAALISEAMKKKSSYYSSYSNTNKYNAENTENINEEDLTAINNLVNAPYPIGEGSANPAAPSAPLLPPCGGFGTANSSAFLDFYRGSRNIVSPETNEALDVLSLTALLPTVTGDELAFLTTTDAAEALFPIEIYGDSYSDNTKLANPITSAEAYFAKRDETIRLRIVGLVECYMAAVGLDCCPDGTGGTFYYEKSNATPAQLETLESPKLFRNCLRAIHLLAAIGCDSIAKNLWAFFSTKMKSDGSGGSSSNPYGDSDDIYNTEDAVDGGAYDTITVMTMMIKNKGGIVDDYLFDAANTADRKNNDANTATNANDTTDNNDTDTPKSSIGPTITNVADEAITQSETKKKNEMEGYFSDSEEEGLSDAVQKAVVDDIKNTFSYNDNTDDFNFQKPASSSSAVRANATETQGDNCFDKANFEIIEEDFTNKEEGKEKVEKGQIGDEEDFIKKEEEEQQHQHPPTISTRIGKTTNPFVAPSTTADFAVRPNATHSLTDLD